MSDDELRAFRQVKTQLASATTLAYYRPGRPVRVFTDAACTKGFDYAVQQLQPDNEWRPLMVGSRALTAAETRYAPIEAELTAVAWALRKARKFLVGAPRFVVYTDHRPLVLLVNNKRFDVVANARLLRSLLKCRDFDLEVQYIEGTANVFADVLSRHPVSAPDPEDHEVSLAASRHVI